MYIYICYYMEQTLSGLVFRSSKTARGTSSSQACHLGTMQWRTHPSYSHLRTSGGYNPAIVTCAPVEDTSYKPAIVTWGPVEDTTQL